MKSYGLGPVNDQVEIYDSIVDKGLQAIQRLKKYVNQPEYNKPSKTYLLSEVERLLNIPRTSIKDRELAGKFKYTKNGQHKYYRLSDINEIRAQYSKGFFRGKLDRPTNLEPVIVCFSMFKGGVGKTTHACHLAAHCAISGLKTLLIDLDPQASASFMFGYVPSVDLSAGETIYSALINDSKLINSIIKPTHYDGLDIITSGLELQGADLSLPNQSLNNSSTLGSPLFRLKTTLNQLNTSYDIIILDCAPNHGAVTLNALTASNSIILPISPNMLSFGSSIHFIQTLHELAQTLNNYKLDKEIDLNKTLPTKATNSNKQLLNADLVTSTTNSIFRVLITNDPGDSESQDVIAATQALYGDYLLPRPMIRTIALARTSNDISLLYDQKRTTIRRSKESFDRGLAAMKTVNDDILNIFASFWGLQ